MRNLLIAGIVGLGAVGCKPDSEEPIREPAEYFQPQTIDSSYARIDTLALKERLHQDYADTYTLADLMHRAAENNPKDVSEALRSYFDVDRDIWKRLEARLDSLLKARDAMGVKK
jgi:hypothetical protein